MSTKYKPKHKRPESVFGSTPRGPERWARAYANALARPRSKGGRLLHNRIVVAVDLSDVYDDVPYAHFQRDVDPRDPYPANPTYKVDSVTCGSHCAVMQVQLDHQTSGNYEATRNIFDGEYVTCKPGTSISVPHYRYVRELQPGDIARTRRCAVCGSSVKKK